MRNAITTEMKKKLWLSLPHVHPELYIMYRRKYRVYHTPVMDIRPNLQIPQYALVYLLPMRMYSRLFYAGGHMAILFSCLPEPEAWSVAAVYAGMYARSSYSQLESCMTRTDTRV